MWWPSILVKTIFIFRSAGVFYNSYFIMYKDGWFWLFTNFIFCSAGVFYNCYISPIYCSSQGSISIGMRTITVVLSYQKAIQVIIILKVIIIFVDFTDTEWMNAKVFHIFLQKKSDVWGSTVEAWPNLRWKRILKSNIWFSCQNAQLQED